jgi:ferric-dicitrate binding protein FerR (iron transport regulator)
MPVPHHGLDALAEKKSKTGPIIGVVLFVILAAGLLLYLNRAGEEAAMDKAFESADAANYTSRAGQTAKTTLQDSTALNLGASTKLVIPPGYGQRWRAVQLDGTVELTPPPNASPPLDIRAVRNVTVTSSSGTVGVHAFSTDNWVAVRVKNGTAEVKAPGGSKSLADGQGAIVDSSGALRDATPAELSDAFSWTEGNLTITNQPLSEAIKRIGRWYGIELTVKDKSLLTRPITMTTTITESGKMIDSLQAAGKVKFGYEGGRRVLTDASGR